MSDTTHNLTTQPTPIERAALLAADEIADQFAPGFFDATMVSHVAAIIAKHYQAARDVAPECLGITQEQIDRHTTTAWECPPQSLVVLVSSLKRLTDKNAAAPSPAPAPAQTGAPVYQLQCREIGEGDWCPCDYRHYTYCQKSPEMDTRIVEVAPDHSADALNMVSVPRESLLVGTGSVATPEEMLARINARRELRALLAGGDQ